MTPRFPPCPKTRPGGFTLIEMVVSLAVISVLLVGMTSAVVLASKALPTNDGPAAATVATARALHQLQDELRAATAVPVRTATSVTINLPDRDGDGRPEVITYAWAGTPGDPLTRAANGGAALVLLDEVQELGLTYTTQNQELIFPGVARESDEQLLSSYDGDLNYKNFTVTKKNWIGGTFTPNIPAAADAWRITRFSFDAQQDGGSHGLIKIELQPWSNNEPTGAVLDSVTINANELAETYAWHNVTFPSGGSFAPGETAAIVIRCGDGTGGDLALVRYDNRGNSGNIIFTVDEGGYWFTLDYDILRHFVYGTITTTDDDWTYTCPRVTAVGVELSLGQANTVAHHATVPLVNAPVAADAWWDADFSALPTTLDLDADGVADWHATGTMRTSDLVNGEWIANDRFRSAPDALALDQPFVMDVWAHDTTDNADGGGVTLAFDRSSGNAAGVVVRWDRVAEGQQVSVSQLDAAGTLEQWVQATVDTTDAIHVRLVADPERDQVAVMIDGVMINSFAYDRRSSAGNDVLKTFVDTNNNGFCIDHLRLAAAGSVTVTPDAHTGTTSSGVIGDLVGGITGIVGGILGN